jgi:hypothetical protein
MTAPAMELDHVVLGVTDLEAAAQRLSDQHRLTAVPGGRHASAGTHNSIVPLGDAYLELLAVEEEAVAQTSPFGRWVLERVADADTWLGWCLRTDDLDGVCARLGLEPMAMERGKLSWRIAGVQRVWEDPSLPFFIQWDVPDDQLPGRAGGPTSASDAPLSALEVGADEAAVRAWAGDLPGSVRIVDGPPGILAVAVAGAGGVEVIRNQ